MYDYDIAINDGTIIDGTGKPAYVGSLGIVDKKIVKISKTSLVGEKNIDAGGKIITPGFIDVHSHGDLLPLLNEKYRFSRIKQGITSEITGQCGISALPLNSETMGDYREYIKPIVGDIGSSWKFSDLKSYSTYIEGRMPHNMGFLVGLSTLRSNICGFEDRQLTSEELDRMVGIYEGELLNGALGLSLGLSYLPGVFARKEELLALGKVTAKYGAFIMAHIRSHGRDMLKAMEEFVNLGKETGARVHISHCRSYGNKDFGVESKKILAALEEYRSEGIYLTVDQHPYINGSTFLNQLLPPFYRDMERIRDRNLWWEIEEKVMDKNYKIEGWDNFLLMVGYENILVPKYGKDLLALSKDNKREPFKNLMDILIKEQGNTVMVVRNMFSEEDIVDLLKDEYTYIGSDGLPSGANPHPRIYGAFPKIISRYVRELKALTLEEGIRKMAGSGFFKERGLIKEGYIADILVIDKDKFAHREDYINQNKDPEGLDLVVIGGNIAYEEGLLKGYYGSVLLREDNMNEN